MNPYGDLRTQNETPNVHTFFILGASGASILLPFGSLGSLEAPFGLSLVHLGTRGSYWAALGLLFAPIVVLLHSLGAPGRSLGSIWTIWGSQGSILVPNR